ncbi:MAG: hypothetical protein HYT31_01180 [Parcubacteria group bacterium]|nr:hypothetical protein [Parcubacteria group bacterium]
MSKEKQPSKLPSFFKPILWSYDVGRLDATRDKKTIITAAVNYGSLRHWRWIAKRYGRRGVGRVLAGVPRTALRAHVRPLAGIIFSVKSYRYAPRGAHKKGRRTVSKAR